MDKDHRRGLNSIVDDRETLARIRAELASMTMLNALSNLLTATPDLPSILYEILDATIKLQGADFDDVQLYDEATGTLKIVSHRGLDQRFLDYFATVDARETSACGLALQSGTRVIIEDVTADQDFEPHRRIAASTGFRAVQSTPLLDRNSGKPIAADVIAFRLAESALREGEARLSAVLNQAPGGVGLFDNRGELVLRGGYLSSLWRDVIPSRDPASLRRWRSFDANGAVLPLSQYPGERALRGETVTPGLDFLHTADDGREIWICVSAAPFRDGAGEISGAVAILQNVDDAKRAEQRLRESEARLQAAVDLVKLGCYAWNPQTNELRWDDALRAMWGLPAGAPVDYDIWRSCVHPDDFARVDAAIQRCTDPAGDGVYDIEYRVTGKTDAVERWIATRGQTNFENSVPVSFYGVALDVTDRKALERRVQARTRELEQANRQLRSEIEQRAIAEAEVQQLQRLDAIGQITSGVAHDFNNLLSVVLTNARLLSRNLRDRQDQEGVGLIRAAAERGVNLTEQLLAFSRKQRLEPQHVDLNQRIIGMGDLLGVTLGGKVQLQTMLAADLWPALVDPTQIELVILNLAINARDAMQGGGTLTLETFNAIIDRGPRGTGGLPPGQYVGLAVNDTGVGIPDDVLPRVFEPFFTTKPLGKNSGLGLAQVFGFARQSGGGVELATRVGEGTSVKVFLPRSQAVPTDPEPLSIDPRQGSQTKALATIMVVDDNAAVLKTTLRLLDALGFPTVPAASGMEALQLLESGPEIDLVLADFAMPEMNGVELARAIKIKHPALPVILVTGYGNREFLNDPAEARLLRKPYPDDVLLEEIKRALN